MRLDELFGLFGKGEDKELKQLAQKVKGMYSKAIDNYEAVLAQNADAFKQSPRAAFDKWFEHMFYKNIKRVVDDDNLHRQITDKNLPNLIKPLIMLASQNYYLKPKTGYAGAKSLVQIAPMIAKQDLPMIKVINKFFGTYLERGASKDVDPNPVLKKGTEITIPKGDAVPQDTTFKWMGQMWMTDKNQPASKEMQGVLTQKAIDDGMTG